MPVAETCPVCQGEYTQPVWIKQKDVEVQRCACCNEIWPFGQANERPVEVQLEVMAISIANNSYAHNATLIESDSKAYDGWDSHHLESLGMDHGVLVSDDPLWHVGWLAREILYGDAADKMEALNELAQATQDAGGYPELSSGQVLVHHDGEFHLGTIRDDGVTVVRLNHEAPGTFTVSASETGQREMDRLWAEMEAKSKEPWNPPDVFSGTPTEGEVTGLQGIPSITEDERTP